MTPKGEWGKGNVEWWKCRTDDETNGSIVAYWTPDQLPEPGEMELNAPSPSAVMKTNCMRQITHGCDKTVVGRGCEAVEPIRQPDGTIAFVVDFTGAEMKKLAEDTPLTAQTSIGDNGEIVESTVRYDPVTKGWRLVMRVKVKDAKKTTEMRAALVNADRRE
ncbi:glucan biosynthesis protein [Shigella flexneri]